NAPVSGGWISVYAPGAVKPSYRLTGLKDPVALTLDPSGNLVVCDSSGELNGAIDIYSTSTHKRIRQITEGLLAPVSVPVDASRTLYVGNKGDFSTAGNVREFANEGTSSTATIVDFYSPQALAIDANGNLWVADLHPTPNPGYVTAYAPGSTKAFR